MNLTRFNDLSTTQKASKEDRFNILAAEIDANVSGDSTIAGRVEALETIIGDPENPAEGTILARLAALETPAGDG